MVMTIDMGRAASDANHLSGASAYTDPARDHHLGQLAAQAARSLQRRHPNSYGAMSHALPTCAALGASFTGGRRAADLEIVRGRKDAPHVLAAARLRLREAEERLAALLD